MEKLCELSSFWPAPYERCLLHLKLNYPLFVHYIARWGPSVCRDGFLTTWDISICFPVSHSWVLLNFLYSIEEKEGKTLILLCIKIWILWRYVSMPIHLWSWQFMPIRYLVLKMLNSDFPYLCFEQIYKMWYFWYNPNKANFSLCKTCLITLMSKGFAREIENLAQKFWGIEFPS